LTHLPFAAKAKAMIDHQPEKPLAPSLPAGLYVTATPIGNLADMTARAVSVLKSVDFILCEDSRITGKLLRSYGITTKMRAYHDHNGDKIRPSILAALAENKALALVSDAGTPLISDPGFKLVRAVREAGHKVFTVPGASALTAALSIAGLPTDRFCFNGFLPPKSAARKKLLEPLLAQDLTQVFYESGPRLPATLADIASLAPSRPIAIARELTKLHEEVINGNAKELATLYQGKTVKGEIVLLIHGQTKTDHAQEENLNDLLKAAMEKQSLRDAVTEIAALTGLPKNTCYERALILRDTKQQK
jgi:16S rRNA (cytidine1402-2'-O)-methyltransferase